MLPYLIGAGLGGLAGGVSAYQKRGDIGEALLGAGIGAGLGAGGAGLGSLAGSAATRFAGQALAPLATGSSLGALQTARQIPLLGKLIPEGASLAQQAAMGSKLVEAAKAAPKLAGTLAGTGAGLAATGLVAPASAAAAGVGGKVARGALGLGAGTLGYPTPEEINYAALSGGAVPELGKFGAGGTLSDPLNVVGRVGMAQRLETSKTAEAQRDALRMLLPEISQAAEFRSKAELQRQLAAAGVRQNIVTAANMLERSQQAAQQMGLNAASQAGAALTSQYQYQ